MIRYDDLLADAPRLLGAMGGIADVISAALFAAWLATYLIIRRQQPRADLIAFLIVVAIVSMLCLAGSMTLWLSDGDVSTYLTMKHGWIYGLSLAIGLSGGAFTCLQRAIELIGDAQPATSGSEDR